MAVTTVSDQRQGGRGARIVGRFGTHRLITLAFHGRLLTLVVVKNWELCIGTIATRSASFTADTSQHVQDCLLCTHGRRWGAARPHARRPHQVVVAVECYRRLNELSK